VYVDAGAAPGSVTCTAAAPCKTFLAGLAQVTATRKYVKLAAGMYAERVLVDGKTVDVRGPVGAGASAELTASVDPVIDVRASATLAIRGLRIRFGAGTGLRCVDSAVTLRDVGIEDNIGRGVDSNNCGLTFERVRVLRNFRGGLAVSRGRIAIRNSFIGANGSSSSALGGASITEPFDLAFEFNTLVDNTVSAGLTAGLFCQAATTVSVADNIVVGAIAKQVDADSCAPRYTLSTQMIAGATNLRATPMFRNAPAGDYHLVAGSPGVDQADAAATLATDIDGESRPSGARPDIGADELH
jgi:hypothetical protein